MIFSYYFDTEKTHRLNFIFRSLQFTEKEAGVDEILFSAEVEEIVNNRRRKREVRTGVFTFPPLPEGSDAHDIDFSRIRYGNENKWIFTVTNNRNNDQRVTVGLISEITNKNPIGMDIIHDDEDYNATLRANNLAVLHSGYQVPILTQTLVNNTFNNAGFPEGFSSQTAVYSNTLRLYRAKEWRQNFFESIPRDTYFKIEMDLAPESMNPLAGTKIFELVVDKVGSISFFKNYLEYMHEGALPVEARRVFFTEQPTVDTFWKDEKYTSNARMLIEGDGAGTLKIRYNNKEILGWYDNTKAISFMHFRGMTIQPS